MLWESPHVTALLGMHHFGNAETDRRPQRRICCWSFTAVCFSKAIKEFLVGFQADWDGATHNPRGCWSNVKNLATRWVKVLSWLNIVRAETIHGNSRQVSITLTVYRDVVPKERLPVQLRPSVSSIAVQLNKTPEDLNEFSTPSQLIRCLINYQKRWISLKCLGPDTRGEIQPGGPCLMEVWAHPYRPRTGLSQWVFHWEGI